MSFMKSVIKSGLFVHCSQLSFQDYIKEVMFNIGTFDETLFETLLETLFHPFCTLLQFTEFNLVSSLLEFIAWLYLCRTFHRPALINGLTLMEGQSGQTWKVKSVCGWICQLAKTAEFLRMITGQTSNNMRISFAAL